jgi:hypothetical protein
MRAEPVGDVCGRIASAYSRALYGHTATNNEALCTVPVIGSVKKAGSPA